MTPRNFAIVGAVVCVLAAAIAGHRWRQDAATVTAGRKKFDERCGVCHGTDGDGGDGPSLRGVVGRKAGSDAQFGYTRALGASVLRWDVPTLDRFLTMPVALVPGTSMTMPTEVPEDRRALIAYLSTLRPSTKTAVHRRVEVRPTLAMPGLRTGREAFGGFRSDGPGVRRHITVADLPAPFATESVRHNAKVADAPEGAVPRVPPGFQAALFAKGLKAPRLLRFAPNGDLFVAASDEGEIQVVRAGQNAESPRVDTFAKGFDDPFGIAFFPAGPAPRWVYVAEVNAIYRYPYVNGDRVARGPRETVVARLARSTGGHTMRDLAFSSDGRQMFVAVGSASNVAEKLPASSPEAIRTFEAEHGLGASWDAEESRADVLVFDADGKNGRPFATGLRNCSGLTVNPSTGDVWCAVNERDKLGDDLVPDYVTRVRDKAFYGWPWYYLGDHEDPRQAGARKDLVGKMTLPDVLLQPHSAPLQITFYDGPMFPADYRGSAFVALHGSWNRGSRTGYKVVRILMKGGAPTGEYEDFMTGFVIDEERVWARPVGVAVDKDGSLFVSDDGNGTVWRVTYR